MIDGRYVLADELLLFPVEQLAASVQAQLATRAGQYAATNPGGRATSAVLSPQTAALLERFRTPVSITQAVLDLSEELRADPHIVLDDAFATIRRLVDAGFLLTEDRPGARRAPPERLADMTVTAVVQRLPDVTVLRGRTDAGAPVAIKLLCDPADERARRALRREAEVLRRARGCRVPSLVLDACGEDEPFLATGWIDGTIVTEHAAVRRRPWDPAWRTGAARLALALLDAYAELHERGIVHGDVHPKNVLVSASGAVTLLDFGLARVPGDPLLDRVGRGGVPAFKEPEWARAQLQGHAAPPATAAADQHAAGALLYQLLTGSHFVETVGDARELLVRIADDEPRAFSDHGLPPWRAVEGVLARMLAKRPEERFGSLAQAAAALRAATRRPPRRREEAGLGRLLHTTSQRLSRDGGLIERGLPAAPRASVNYGAAGVAYFHYRLALASGDPQQLAVALRWIGWAHRHGGDEHAYHARELGILPSRVGRVSIYHSVAGSACVEALVANAMGDTRRAVRATTAFAAASRLPCPSVDLTVGRASTLVGAALLWEALRGTQIAERCGLAELGDDILRAIVGDLPPAVDGDALRYRGIAHGWGGVLYAALRWCEATHALVPGVVTDRLTELAAAGRGPHDIPMRGWCHGPAGHVHLWAAAARVIGAEGHVERALQAAEDAWPQRERVPTLCCGLAGQAYAMLAAHELSREARWVSRAHELATRAAREVGTRWCLPNSLWKGDVGVALLGADLERPHDASMPLFAREGWPPAPQDAARRAIAGLQ